MILLLNRRGIGWRGSLRLKLHRYWTNACRNCSLKSRCTPGPQRRIKRWEHEDVLEAVQKRLDENPHAMRTRPETSEHPFGTIKMRMGATHFLTKTLPKVATEMALCILTYNLTRVLNIVGVPAVLERLRDRCGRPHGHADRGVHAASQDRPQGRSGCPLNIFSPILGRLAGAHIPGSDISTQPRPKADIQIFATREAAITVVSQTATIATTPPLKLS